MKVSGHFVFVFLLFLNITTNAQFYYKDQVLPRQSVQQLQQLKSAKVKAVKLTSFESDGAVTQDFTGEQTINRNYTVITTVTKSRVSDSSELTTFYNAAGQLIKTIDTTDGFKSVTEYRYDGSNRLTSITNSSISPGLVAEEEQHVWMYAANGTPEKMWKIKNKTDTTHVTFVTDEKANVVEEHSTRNGRAIPTYYYYYDDKNRLTDIVRYNERAKRLLPDYVFEYDEEDRISSVIIVPESGSDYEKWFYSYYENGLKGQEACYNKRQELQGRTEYEYLF